MKNLRSVGALLAICGVFSCATAISDGTVSGPNTPPDGAGSNAGGSGGLGEEGGSATVGGSAPQTGGSPGSAGKGDGGKANGGTGSGGKAGTAGSAGKGGSGTGTGGTVATGGSSSTGGKAGTGSSGAAGGAVAGATGTAGGGATGPCDNPVDVPAGTMNTGNFNSLEAKCFRTKSTFNNVGCSNFQGRTLKVNNVATTCPSMGTFAPMSDGYTYLDASAGSNLSASIYWFTS